MPIIQSVYELQEIQIYGNENTEFAKQSRNDAQKIEIFFEKTNSQIPKIILICLNWKVTFNNWCQWQFE